MKLFIIIICSSHPQIQIVVSVKVMSPGLIESLDGDLGVDPSPVYHPPADHVASPVQSPGAVHSNKLTLFENILCLLNSFEELLDMSLIRDTSSVRLHKYFLVSYPSRRTLFRRVVLGAGHV